jgi:hypothetical protein
MAIFGKYQNQYTTKCQAHLRETEIQKSVTKLFSCILYHVCICICMCVYTHTHTHTHTEWYKSLHTMGKWSLYLQNVRFMGTIKLISHADVSPLPRRTTSGVTCAYASLMRSFRGPVLCSFTWYSMSFKCICKQKSSGWGLDTSETTQRVHGNQSHDLETSLTNSARRYHILMYGDFLITLCMRV